MFIFLLPPYLDRDAFMHHALHVLDVTVWESGAMMQVDYCCTLIREAPIAMQLMQWRVGTSV